jgi:hypothetical protein
MMAEYATFVTDGDRMIAFDGDHVIASGTDHTKVAATAEEYFGELRKENDRKDSEAKRSSATHITTPNGDTGTILGRTASVFSDAITVRFENGQIRHYDTFVGDGLEFSKREASVPDNPVDYFQSRLDETFDHGRDGLVSRLDVLDDVRQGATRLASAGVSFADGQKLDSIVLTASAERNEVREALDHLVTADAEAFAPPVRQYQAAEQASVGHSDDWLGVVAAEMIAESEAQDYDKLLEEGPTMFISALETGTLGHEGSVREMASEHIHSKTAGFEGEAVDDYRSKFVASTELARRQELSYRKETAHKEAAVIKTAAEAAPDEALFL